MVQAKRATTADGDLASQPADRFVLAIVSNAHRLVCVLIPKCASTSLIDLFAALHGLASAHPGRNALPTMPLAQFDPAQDVGVVKMPGSQLAAMQARLQGYSWFAVVRNPYDRLRANYNNKINRFARRFRPEVYALAKARQALMGPSAWKDSTATAPYMQSRISYREFVDTLLVQGIDWDAHYRLQIDHLRLDRVDYSRLVKLEEFSDGIAGVLDDAGVPQQVVSRVNLDRQLNRSASTRGAAARGDAAERSKVYQLYADDFVRLGYER